MKTFSKFNFFHLFYGASVIFFIFLLQKVLQIDDPHYRHNFTLGLSLAFIGYWLTIFLKPATKASFHIAATIALFALFLHEYIIEITGIFVPKNLEEIKKEGLAKLQIPFDKRTKLQVITDYRKEGIQAYPAIYPHQEFLEQPQAIFGGKLFPLAGISHALTVLCNESGYYAEYTSDQYGFNNPPDVYQQPVNIALLGDSMVHGSCVNPQDNLRQKIANQITANVQNLGIGSNGPLLELAILTEYVSLSRPQVVLWFFSEPNDLTDLANELKVNILAKYLDPTFTQSLASKQNLIDNELSAYVDNKIKHQLGDKEIRETFWDPSLRNVLLLRHIRFRLGLFNPISYHPFAEFEKVLSLAQQKTQSWGGQFIMVYLPMYSETNKKDPGLEHIYQNVIAITNRLEIPVINLKDAFSSEEDPLKYFPFRLPGHYTPEGNALLAGKIADNLRQYRSG